MNGARRIDPSRLSARVYVFPDWKTFAIDDGFIGVFSPHLNDAPVYS